MEASDDVQEQNQGMYPTNTTEPPTAGSSCFLGQPPRKRLKESRGVAISAGESYECKTLTYFFLRLLAAGHEFQLVSNAEAVSTFDDIYVNHRKLPDDPWSTFCVQLEHREETGRFVLKSEFLELVGAFSLVTFSDCWRTAKLSIKEEHDSVRKPQFILFTNACASGDLVDEVSSSELLSTGGKAVKFKPGGKVYGELWEWVDFKEALTALHGQVDGLGDEEVGNRLKEVLNSDVYQNKSVTSYKTELLKSPRLSKLEELLKKLEPVRDKETFSSFLAELHVYTGQVSEWELNDKIKQELAKVWKCSNDVEAERMYDELQREMIEWRKNGNTYLTQDSSLWLDVIKSQTELLSKDTIDALKGTEVEFEESLLQALRDKIDKKGKAGGILNLRVDKRTAASSLRVHRALAESVANVLHVNVEVLLAREDDVLSAWATRWCPVLVVECDTELRPNDADRIRGKILEAIDKPNETKLLVLIAPDEHQLNAQLKPLGSYRSCDDECSWNDLTETTKGRIFSQNVVINGMQTKDSLANLVEGNIELIKNVNLEVISQLMSGDLRFGKNLDKKGEIFIMRRLKKSPEGLSFDMNFVRTVPEKVVLVVALPGMGKSTLFTHLAQSAKAEDPSAWVVQIKPINFVQHLKKADSKKCNVDDFFDQVALNSGNSLEKLLFRSLRRKLIVFVDGVDEVCSDYKQEVFTLLGSLKEMPLRQLWVSSRPSCREDLERELGVKTYFMDGFSIKDQKEFFSKALKAKVPSISHDALQDTWTWLTESLGRNNSILEAPFMCFMSTETFPKIYANREILANKQLNAMTLYELMLIVKHEVYCVAKTKAAHRYLVAVKNDKERYLKRWLHNLTLAALSVMFRPDDISMLQFEGKEGYQEDLAKFVEETSVNWETIGIIEKVVNGVPHFVHRSFAEYLIAKMLASCFENNKVFLKRIFNNYHYSLVAEMFNWYLAEDHPLHVAILERDVEATKILLTSATPSDVNEEDAGGRTPVHLAVILSGTDPHPDRIRLVKLLLQEHKANPNAPDKVLGWVPMQYAEASRAWDALQIILEGGEHDLEHLHGWSELDRRAIIDAARKAPLPVFCYLVEKRGGKLDCRALRGETVIHEAVKRRDVDLLEYLLKKGLSLDAKDREGDTALHYATSRGSEQIAALLQRHGADVNAVNNKGVSLLHQAAWSNNLSVAELLLGKGAKKECRDVDGNTPLHVALRRRSEHVRALLLRHGADVKAVNNKGETMLHLVAWSDNLAVAKLLLDKGVSMECRDEEGNTPLHVALRRGRKQVADLLLGRGVDVDAANIKGETMLHLTALNDNVGIAKLLLMTGASVECRDMDGNTPLHVASENGSQQVATLLLHHRADVNAVNNEGQTPLGLAALRGRLTLVASLKAKGARVT